MDTPRAVNATKEIDPERIAELYTLLGLDDEKKRESFLAFYNSQKKSEEVVCIWTSDSVRLSAIEGD
jgi:superfamily II DNA/RNA helicase